MRRRRIAPILGILVAVSLALAACGSPTKPPASEAAVTVDKIEGSELKRLTLSEHAAQRLGVTTVEVGTTGGTITVPDSAVLYDKHGTTWAYTNPTGLEFVRAEITVDHIARGVAYLDSGLEPGARVVTVGAAELWGVETGVGGGH
jgi:hypothetical protein